MGGGAGTTLVVVTGAVAEELGAVPPLVRTLIESASELVVVTPVLTSRLEWLATDVDRARYEADERLGKVMGQIAPLLSGGAAVGQVGDEDPLTAFDDAVREYRPDHLLIALRAADGAAWQERGLIDRIRERFHLPMTVFELDRAGRVPGPAAP